MSSLLSLLIEDHQESMLRTQNLLRNCPWENLDFYADWCAQGYYFVAHATRILAGSAARFGIDQDQLHIRFLDHSQEEKHHEKLFEHDLRSLGRRASDYGELEMTQILYQSQYYFSEHENPIAPMGGVFYLEGVSVFAGTEIYQRVQKAHGADACTFLKVHVHNDEDHIKKAMAVLSAMSSRELEVTMKSYKLFRFAYENHLVSLCQRQALRKQEGLHNNTMVA